MFGISRHHELSGCRALSRALNCRIKNASNALQWILQVLQGLTLQLGKTEEEEDWERLRKYSSIPKPWASWSCLVQALRLLSSSGSCGAGWMRILDSVPAGPCQAGHCRCTQGIQVNLVPPAPSSGSQRPQPQDTASGALQEHAELLILRCSLCEEGLAFSKLSRTRSRGLGM